MIILSYCFLMAKRKSRYKGKRQHLWAARTSTPTLVGMYLVALSMEWPRRAKHKTNLLVGCCEPNFTKFEHYQVVSILLNREFVSKCRYMVSLCLIKDLILRRDSLNVEIFAIIWDYSFLERISLVSDSMDVSVRVPAAVNSPYHFSYW